MYAYFDDTKRFWWYLLIVYVASFPTYTAFRFFHLSTGLSVLLVLLLEICLLLGIVNHTIHKANTYMQEVMDTLFQECDPISFSQQIKALLKKPVKNQTQQCLLTYYLAIAYSVQKKPKDALIVLSEKRDEIEKLRNDTKFLILHLCIHLMIIQQRMDEAKDLYAMLCTLQIKKTIYPYDFSYMKQEVGMRLAYMQAEISTHTYIDFLKECLQDSSRTTFEKVLLYERLWKLMKRNQQTKERILCAYYIKQNGNTMACVEEAKRDVKENS